MQDASPAAPTCKNCGAVLETPSASNEQPAGSRFQVTCTQCQQENWVISPEKSETPGTPTQPIEAEPHTHAEPSPGQAGPGEESSDDQFDKG